MYMESAGKENTSKEIAGKEIASSGANWGGWGRRPPPPPPPKIPPNIFLLVLLIQCSIYVHAYQAFVDFST